MSYSEGSERGWDVLYSVRVGCPIVRESWVPYSKRVVSYIVREDRCPKVGEGGVSYSGMSYRMGCPIVAEGIFGVL